MKTKWKDTTSLYKFVTVFSIIVCIAIVVLGILQIFEIWTKAINLCCPLIGVNLLCQTYLQWKPSRKTAYFSLAAALFIFGCAIVVFFVK